MMRIGLLDDDISFLYELENLVLSYQTVVNREFEIEIYESGEKLLKDIKDSNKNFDILFLDISMNSMDGVTVGQCIRKVMNNYLTEIIYVSSYTNYFRDLFTVQPFGFIDKPIDNKIFFEVFVDCIKKITSQSSRFVYRFNRTTKFVHQKDILYFESNKRIINVVTASYTDTFTDQLDILSERVDDFYFCRTHKSFLINLSHASLYKASEVIMDNGVTIPISKAHKKDASSKIHAYIEGVFND